MIDLLNRMKSVPNAFKPLKDGAVRECPACGCTSVTHESDYPSNVAPFKSAQVLYCSECGLGYVPDYGPVLQSYYVNDYAESNRKDRDAPPEVYFSEAYKAQSKAIGRYFARAQRQEKLLETLCARFDSVLDYGSGPGYFLYCSKAKRKFAFEPDQASRKYLDYIGATVIERLEDIQPNTFDAIVASHSIEHLVAEDLIATLRRLIGALKPDGRLLIEVPQGGHSYLDLSGARQDPHTLFFTPQALSAAIVRAGGKLCFQDALSKVPIPRRDNGLYSPPNDPFFKANRGALVVVCTVDTTFVA